MIGFFRCSPVPFCYELLRVEEVADRTHIWSLAVASSVPDAMHSHRNSYKELIPELPNPRLGGTTDVRSPERVGEWEEAFLRVAPTFCTELCRRRGPELVAETLFAREAAAWFLRQFKWRDCQPTDALSEFLCRTTSEQQAYARKILTPSLLDSFLIENEAQEQNALATLKLVSAALIYFWGDSPLEGQVSPGTCVNENVEVFRIVKFMSSCIFNPTNWNLVPPEERLAID